MPIIAAAKGDIVYSLKEGLLSDKVVVHGCNCATTMGAGIARGLADAYPVIPEVDRKFANGKDPKLMLGHYSLAHVNDCHIVNAYTQLVPSTGERAVNYAAVANVFTRLNRELPTILSPTVVIPLIGAGLAMGEWHIIEQIINDATPDIDIVVVEDYIPNTAVTFKE